MINLLILLPIALAIKNITILGTNDVHGHLIPIDVVKSQDLTIHIGGLSLFSSYLNVLRNTEENILWLDGGD